VSENEDLPAKKWMMAPVPKPTHDELAALRADLVRRGAGRVPAADIEDVAQEALLKVVREDLREGAPGLARRGGRAFKHARAEYFRRRNRAKEPPLEALEDQADIEIEDPVLRVFELEDLVRGEAGPDAVEVARARASRLTQRELGDEPGWTPQRAEAASRRLRRARRRLAEEMLDE
jgi:hypothetical protein